MEIKSNNIQQLLESAEVLVQELLQAYQSESTSTSAPLAKSETASLKKEDEKKEELKDELKEKPKEEGSPKADSYYESQAPEAQKPEEAAPKMQEEAPMMEEDPSAILAELDDEALQALYEQIKAEIMKRAAPKMEEPAKMEEESKKEEQKEDLGMAKSLKETAEKLVKAEQALEAKDKEIAELKQAVHELLDVVKIATSKPIVRAATSTNINYIKKEELAKSELDDQALRKSLDELFFNKEKMKNLKSYEYDALIRFYSGAPAVGQLRDILTGIVKK